MKFYFLLFVCFVSVEMSAQLYKLSGASIIAQDEKQTFLGTISNEFASNSIYNEFGNYGSEFSSSSIWNEFSTFGSEFSSLSPFNEYTSTPPMIVKDNTIIGYLTINGYINGAISPYLLKSKKSDF